MPRNRNRGETLRNRQTFWPVWASISVWELRVEIDSREVNGLPGTLQGTAPLLLIFGTLLLIVAVSLLAQGFRIAASAAYWAMIYLRDLVVILAQGFPNAASAAYWAIIYMRDWVVILAQGFHTTVSLAYWVTVYLRDWVVVLATYLNAITITGPQMMLLALVIGMLWVVLKTSTKEDSTAFSVEDEPDKALSEVDGGQCVVCLDGESTNAFTPCGHICCCEECCDRIMNSIKVCPLCRQPCAWGGRMYKG